MHRDWAKAPRCAESGPSGGRDSTTWSLSTYLTVDSFLPDMGMAGVKTMSLSIAFESDKQPLSDRDQT